MRVAIDLRMVGPIPHGIARYALALWNGLPARSDRSYLALLGPTTPEVGLKRPGDERVRTRVPFLSPGEQLELPLVLRRAHVDLLHATSFSVPAAWRGPLVLSLHDLTHLEVPELRTPARVAYYRLIVGPAARRARTVLTVSQYSKQLIARELRVPPERILVAPNATNIPAAEHLPIGDPPIVLAVGNAKPHKNLRLLVQMLPRLRSSAKLILVGNGLAAFAGPNVELAGSVDDERLVRLYRQAALFLCPSVSEGFGLPALEAARCGAPVLAARAGALPEIWQDAAMLLPPDDPAAWGRAVTDLLTDGAARHKLATRCEERAARYQSWKPLLTTADAAYSDT